MSTLPRALSHCIPPASATARAVAAGLACVLWLGALPGVAAATGPGSSVRDDEIAQCRPGEIARWGDGTDRPAIGSPLRLVYRHDGAPARFGAARVLKTLQRAATAWSQCGVPSSVAPWSGPDQPPKDAVLVQWSDAGSQGNFGLANLGQRTLSLSPAAFKLLAERNPAHDAGETLQMVVSHEMGHLFGLMDHSRRCVDVMSYYHDGKGGTCYARDRSQLKTVVEYRASLPTACDIQRCRSVNGLGP